MSSVDQGSPAAGVIHDLGYRNYDGPRLGRGAIARALFAESAKAGYGLGRSTKSKVMPMLLLAAICVPALIMAVVTSLVGLDELPTNYTQYILTVHPLVMIYVAGQAPASVSRDLRFGVMPLYFSRPLERVDYVGAKFAAMAGAVFVFMALPLTILFLGALLAELPLGKQVPDYLRSLVGAAVLALMLAGIGLLIAAITPRRGLGIAAIITVLAVLAVVQVTIQGLAVAEGHDTLAAYAALISPFTLVHGLQDALLGAETVLPREASGLVGAVIFLGVALAILVATFGALLMRYRRVRI